LSSGGKIAIGVVFGIVFAVLIAIGLVCLIKKLNLSCPTGSTPEEKEAKRQERELKKQQAQEKKNALAEQKKA
jgi:phosphotransferase system  glucose/maltose/N-acetylglucosamine-specific IIC component